MTRTGVLLTGGAVAALSVAIAVMIPSLSPRAQDRDDPATPYRSLYSGASPTGTVNADTAAVTLGVRFVVTKSGYVDSVEFYDGTGTDPARRVSLWSADGARLATATAPKGTATGWVWGRFDKPVRVAAGATYVASYFAPAGRYNSVNGGFAEGRGAGPLSVPDHAGVYTYGSGESFPIRTYDASEYLVSPIFVADVGPSRSPAPRGSAAPTPVAVTATRGTAPTGRDEPSAPAPLSSSTTDASVGQVCTRPIFTTSDVNGGVSDGGFYVHNNLWNASPYLGTRGTTEVCSYHSWNHRAMAGNVRHDGAVKTYPNVHKDYPTPPLLSSFTTLTSTEAMTSPGVGIYDVAYDIWVNAVASPSSYEVMIWTENHNQRPAGDIVARGLSFSGRSWDLWVTGNGRYLAFTAPANSTNGWPSNEVRSPAKLDLKAMLDYLRSNGRLPSNATLNQLCFGVEIVDTGDVQRTWNLTDFSLTSN